MTYRLDISGWMKEQDLISIENLAKQIPTNGSMIEFGSYLGRSSWAWASSVDPSVTVYCIDFWRYTFDEWLDNMKEFDNVIPIKEIVPNFTWTHEPVDLIFLDGSHKNPKLKECIEFFLPRLKPGGILCGHDYIEDWPDVIEEVDKLSDYFEVPVKKEGFSIWILETKGDK